MTTPDYRTELADLVRALQGQRCGYIQPGPRAATSCLRQICPVCHPEDYAPSLTIEPEPDPEPTNVPGDGGRCVACILTDRHPSACRARGATAMVRDCGTTSAP